VGSESPQLQAVRGNGLPQVCNEAARAHAARAAPRAEQACGVRTHQQLQTHTSMQSACPHQQCAPLYFGAVPRSPSQHARNNAARPNQTSIRRAHLCFNPEAVRLSRSLDIRKVSFSNRSVKSIARRACRGWARRKEGGWQAAGLSCRAHEVWAGKAWGIIVMLTPRAQAATPPLLRRSCASTHQPRKRGAAGMEATCSF